MCLHRSVSLLMIGCLIYREIRSPSDCNLMQNDLDTLVKWSKTWGMMFNIKKCNIISITNGTKKQDPPLVHHGRGRITSLPTPLTHVSI